MVISGKPTFSHTLRLLCPLYAPPAPHSNIQALRILHEELLERLNYAMTAPYFAGTIFSDTVCPNEQ